jgi:hypothetical protein
MITAMKKIILIAVLLLLSINLGIFLGYFFSTKTERVITNLSADRQTACGPFCLRIAANLYGIPCDESYALSLCPPDANGTRLGDLSKSATKLGMKAKITKLTWKQLSDMQEYSILHVNDNHYVLANPNEKNNGMIRIYDPDIGARWYDQMSLESIWRGTSLILTKDPDFRSSSFVSTPIFWIDRGDLTIEDDAVYLFPIQNKSTKAIELKIDSTSCQCSSAMLERNKLESGEETILTASVKLDNKRGGFQEHIVLLSTCEAEKKTDMFTLAGTVIRQDILSSKRILVGATHRGGSFKEIFVVNDPGNGQLKLVEASLQKSVSWLNFNIACKKVTKTNLEKTKRLNVKLNDWIVTLSAEIRKDAILQKFQLPIIVRTNLVAPFDSLEIPLEGEIVPGINVDPAALIFSDQSPEQSKIIHAKSIIPSLRLPEPQIYINNDIPLQSKTKRVSNQELLIELQLNFNSKLPIKTFTDNIILNFGNEGTINVPVIYQSSVKTLVKAE